ncbi:glycosyltransferase family 2 protein [Alishewanella tabrizica]|uniref:Glycosyltransferase 2-like domain-containing protein n=1 Tax=Alishewanella tabrizica TaxID=671278 RepID=A0ABQ2WMY6_9ALTE|nr:glycosyltransferase [Alishewanella tabrizica]GGW63431.1 hypothetical protein GCM10008111_19350 [Alishewanella tabrizica]
MSAPRVAALMTTYNSAQYVRETIDSVLHQTFDDFEFVIVDDGSTDSTVEIIKSYHDSRINLFCRKENKGVGYSLQHALDFVTAPFIIKVDSDDISHPTRFEKMVSFLLDNPDISLVKSYFEYFADSDDVVSSERFVARKRDARLINSINTEALIAEHLPRWLCVEHTTYCASTEAVRSAGYPNQRLCEDYALFYKMHEQGRRMACLPEVLVQMRLSNNSVTAALDAEKLRLWFGYLLEFKLPRLERLAGSARKLAIYGSGGLARLLYKLLSEAGFEVLCLIEQQATATLTIGQTRVEVRALQDCLGKKIVIAAQPVRLSVMQQLSESGLQEWRDFMVIA